MAFLMGSEDPESPINLLDPHVLELIGTHRCRSDMVTVDHGSYRSVEWRDPDDPTAIHRGFPDNDQPAEIADWGAIIWYKGGLPHRGDDKPAVIYPGARAVWFTDGYIHRDGDRPADVRISGTRQWRINGHLYTPPASVLAAQKPEDDARDMEYINHPH